MSTALALEEQSNFQKNSWEKKSHSKNHTDQENFYYTQKSSKTRIQHLPGELESWVFRENIFVKYQKQLPMLNSRGNNLTCAHASQHTSSLLAYVRKVSTIKPQLLSFARIEQTKP